MNFDFSKPKKIAQYATEKDLKCTGKRYQEAKELNKNIELSQKISAIERYSGVMYSAIDYVGMQQIGKTYFDEHFLILSGMYGLLNPQDMIGDYKLPIETK